LGPDIDPALRELLRQEQLDTVEGVFGFQAGEDLRKAKLGHRRRTRLFLTDSQNRKHELYLKRYDREPLSARLRRWLTYGVRTSPADVEFDNILALRRIGLPTMQPIICGKQRGVWGTRRSYLIVAAVPGEKLDTYISEFLDANVNNTNVLQDFTVALAQRVSQLHRAGYVHRDLYSAHIFLDRSEGAMSLHLIDLARVFAPRWRPQRWRVKDLAQLKFSLPAVRWAQKYWDLFMQEYLGEEAGQAGRLNRKIDRKVAGMRRRHRRKYPKRKA